MSVDTTTAGTETPPEETPEQKELRETREQLARANERTQSLETQVGDMAASLRGATREGLGGAPAPQPGPRISLEEQLRILDEDPKYMNYTPSQKQAIATKLTYQYEIQPEIMKRAKMGTQNAIGMYRMAKVATAHDGAAIGVQFDKAIGQVSIDQLSNLEPGELTNYLDSVWAAAGYDHYERARSAAPPPREEPTTINRGGAAAPAGGGAGVPTIDQVDPVTLGIGRAAGRSDEQILDAFKRAREMGE